MARAWGKAPFCSVFANASKNIQYGQFYKQFYGDDGTLRVVMHNLFFEQKPVPNATRVRRRTRG